MQIQASFRRVLLLLAAAAFWGCGSQEGARSALTGKVGAAGEIVVVCDEAVWNGAVGDTLRSIFDQPFPVLPQYEPWFDLVHLEPKRSIAFGSLTATSWCWNWLIGWIPRKPT